jgi:hypothetical protein
VREALLKSCEYIAEVPRTMIDTIAVGATVMLHGSRAPRQVEEHWPGSANTDGRRMVRNETYWCI